MTNAPVCAEGFSHLFKNSAVNFTSLKIAAKANQEDSDSHSGQGKPPPGFRENGFHFPTESWWSIEGGDIIIIIFLILFRSFSLNPADLVAARPPGLVFSGE